MQEHVIKYSHDEHVYIINNLCIIYAYITVNISFGLFHTLDCHKYYCTIMSDTGLHMIDNSDSTSISYV